MGVWLVLNEPSPAIQRQTKPGHAPLPSSAARSQAGGSPRVRRYFFSSEMGAVKSVRRSVRRGLPSMSTRLTASTYPVVCRVWHGVAWWDGVSCVRNGGMRTQTPKTVLLT